MVYHPRRCWCHNWDTPATKKMGTQWQLQLHQPRMCKSRSTTTLQQHMHGLQRMTTIVSTTQTTSAGLPPGYDLHKLERLAYWPRTNETTSVQRTIPNTKTPLHTKKLLTNTHTHKREPPTDRYRHRIGKEAYIYDPLTELSNFAVASCIVDFFGVFKEM